MPVLLAPSRLIAGGSGADSLPGVKLAGLVIGLLLLFAAIRAMFGKRKPLPYLMRDPGTRVGTGRFRGTVPA